MISFENFILYNLIMITFTWFLHKRHGEDSYDNGFMDAVQLHQEGRLTYDVTHDPIDDVKVITIEVSGDED